jgi:hypothetical protein
MNDVVCPLCQQRRGRRACPALKEQICAVCCGTKRLVEIRCPPDCPYLVTAREHPPVAAVRQQRQDLDFLVEFMRDLNDRQSQLFFLLASLIARYKAPDLESIVDDDVAEAAGHWRDLRSRRPWSHLRTSHPSIPPDV